MKLNLSPIKLWAVALLAAGSFSAPAQSDNRVAKDFEAFKIITDRNIFDPNRRPARGSTAPTVARVVDSFSLAGTMSYSNLILAVFDGSSADYHKVLETGGKIAGYTVGDIRHDSVRLSFETNSIELKVGMQMHRSPDGVWSSAGQSASDSASYAVNNRMRGADRNERRSNSGRNSGRTDPRPAVPTSSAEPASSSDQPGPGAAVPAEANLPPEIANLDPNDPATPLIIRRYLEENGGPGGRNGNQNGQGGNPNRIENSPGGNP